MYLKNLDYKIISKKNSVSDHDPYGSPVSFHTPGSGYR